MHKIIFFLFIITTINLSAQENKWMLIEDESFIQYSAKHLLHKWSGINNNIKGVFLKLLYDLKNNSKKTLLGSPATTIIGLKFFDI